MICLENVSFAFPDSSQLVLKKINMQIEVGDVVHLDGRNGSGKSTLLRVIATELEPTSGKISVAVNLRTAFLDQFAGDMLAMDMSISDHARAFDGRYKNNFYDNITIFDLGLEGRLESFCGELSGGQRQIIALAIGIAKNPTLLCLDEFTSHMDCATQNAAWLLIDAFLSSNKTAVIYVDHSGKRTADHKAFDIGLRQNL